MNGVALVTGGGRGIGRAVATALARAGMAVGVTARTGAELAETATDIEAVGGCGVSIVADIGSPAAVRTAVQRVGDTFGDVTLLVNNAGANRAIGPSWEVDPEGWWEDIAVNLRGPFLCAREVLPAMVAARRGRIINMVSGTAARPFPYSTAYSCSKTALARFSDSLAEETREYGVSVFAVGPGTVRTAMATDVLDSAEGRGWLGGIDGVALVPTVSVCRAVLFLASGEGDALSGRFVSATDDLGELARNADDITARQLYQLRLARQ